jgi:hypothetical protein
MNLSRGAGTFAYMTQQLSSSVAVIDTTSGNIVATVSCIWLSRWYRDNVGYAGKEDRTRPGSSLAGKCQISGRSTF